MSPFLGPIFYIYSIYRACLCVTTSAALLILSHKRGGNSVAPPYPPPPPRIRNWNFLHKSHITFTYCVFPYVFNYFYFLNVNRGMTLFELLFVFSPVKKLFDVYQYPDFSSINQHIKHLSTFLNVFTTKYSKWHFSI